MTAGAPHDQQSSRWPCPEGRVPQSSRGTAGESRSTSRRRATWPEGGSLVAVPRAAQPCGPVGDVPPTSSPPSSPPLPGRTGAGRPVRTAQVDGLAGAPRSKRGSRRGAISPGRRQGGKPHGGSEEGGEGREKCKNSTLASHKVRRLNEPSTPTTRVAFVQGREYICAAVDPAPQNAAKYAATS